MPRLLKLNSRPSPPCFLARLPASVTEAAFAARRRRPSPAKSTRCCCVALDVLIDPAFHLSRGWRAETASGFMFCVCSGGYIRLGHSVAEHEFSSTLEVG
jgi:hypothetical protein